jgi:hypothetical protein
VLALLSAVALTGCTETQPGQAVAIGQSTAKNPSSGSSGQPTVAIPPRPRDIALDGVDPCKLFSQTQLDQIKVNRQRNKTQSEATFKGSPLCLMDGVDGQVSFDYEAWAITTEGIEPWLSGKRNVDAKLVSIDGFPAADYKIRGTSTFDCATAVGVANRQQLMMVFRPSRNTLSQDQMCQKSEQAAAFAVQTLKTLK